MIEWWVVAAMAAGQRSGVGKTEDGVATTEETHAVGRARGRDSIAKGLGTETKDHQGRLMVEMGDGGNGEAPLAGAS
jgi:hypothetical protein